MRGWVAENPTRKSFFFFSALYAQVQASFVSRREIQMSDSSRNNGSDVDQQLPNNSGQYLCDVQSSFLGSGSHSEFPRCGIISGCGPVPRNVRGIEERSVCSYFMSSDENEENRAVKRKFIALTTHKQATGNAGGSNTLHLQMEEIMQIRFPNCLRVYSFFFA